VTKGPIGGPVADVTAAAATAGFGPMRRTPAAADARTCRRHTRSSPAT